MRLNKLPDFGVIFNRVISSWNNWHSRCDRNRSRFNFVSHFVDNIRLRSDEFDSIVSALLREVGSFRQKTITGMNCVDILFFANSNNVRNVEISSDGRFSFTNSVSCVGFCSMRRMLVFCRVDGNSFDIEFRTCSFLRCNKIFA